MFPTHSKRFIKRMKRRITLASELTFFSHITINFNKFIPINLMKSIQIGVYKYSRKNLRYFIL